MEKRIQGPKRALLTWAIATAALFLFAFVIGAQTYRHLRAAEGQTRKPTEDAFTVESTFYPLRITNLSVNPPADMDLIPRHQSGGIASHQNTVVGVRGQGEIFSFSDGKMSRHDTLPLPTGIAELRTLFDDLDPDDAFLIDRVINVRDIELESSEDEIRAYISYTYWDVERQCRSLKVVSNRQKLPFDPASLSESIWSDVFSLPDCFAFSTGRASPFKSPSAGGVLRSSPEGILLGIGDFHLDGVNNPATEEQSKFLGSVVSIGAGPEMAQVVSTGHRDPRGLAVDATGKLYEVEHGPSGGDELNALIPGAHYGWPFETYGTQYGENVWPSTTLPRPATAFTEPSFAWHPSINPSNLIFVNGRFSYWSGDLLIATLANKLVRVRLRNDQTQFAEEINIGQPTRDILQLSDGRLVAWDGINEILLIDAAETTQDDSLLSDLRPELKSALEECVICHSVDSSVSSDTAPTLRGVFGRSIGASDFPYYSAALQRKSGRWDRSRLERFLTEPQDFAPGSTMPKQDLDSEQLTLVLDFLERQR